MTLTPAATPLDPFLHLTREHWDSLAQNTPLPLRDDEVAKLSSLGDPIDLEEVDAVYRPLSALIQLHVEAALRRHVTVSDFMKTSEKHMPFVIAVAGSVAVGKSSTARLLQVLLERWPSTPRVELVTTDGFLFPNAVLEERGIMHRKGFPDSYDRQKLMRFVRSIKAGRSPLEVPVYDHVTYDIVEGKTQLIEHCDILIIEGLNVLQPPRLGGGAQLSAVSDYFDMSIYVDADTADIREWYIKRFIKLQSTAFNNPDSYFNRYADLSKPQARDIAGNIWKGVNQPNLISNIEPTKSRATVILRKGADHRMESVYLRKS